MTGFSAPHLWVPMLVYILYGAAGIFFLASRNAAAKRRWWKPYVVGSGVLFMSVWVLWGFSARLLAIAFPVAALFTWANLGALEFCDACGATALRRLHARETRRCARCGAPLTGGRP